MHTRIPSRLSLFTSLSSSDIKQVFWHQREQRYEPHLAVLQYAATYLDKFLSFTTINIKFQLIVFSTDFVQSRDVR